MDNKTRAHILGESLAKLAFEIQGYFVYTNSSGKAEFDMLISKDGLVYTVEVKTVSVPKESTIGTYYEARLRSVRSNKTENITHSFDNSFIDYLVVIDLFTNKVAIFKANEIKSISTLKIYSDKFKQ